MSWYEQAEQKLTTEYKGAQYDKYASVMKSGVRDALLNFCRQDDEFAQAVAQGGRFEDCMKAVSQNCGSGLSDMEAYRRAAKFYFDGATVQMELRIQLVPAAYEEPRSILLNLTDFF